MDLAEMIVDAAHRAWRWDQILADGGTVLTLDAVAYSISYFVVRASGACTAYVWYPYLYASSGAGSAGRFRMLVHEKNLPVLYLVSSTIVSTFASELARAAPASFPTEVRVRAHMARDPRTILYDRSAAMTAATVATDPDVARCVREAFTVALHAALH